MASSDSEAEDNEEFERPEMKKMVQLEECLKRRTFLADRIEKVEKVLLEMGLISE